MDDCYTLSEYQEAKAMAIEALSAEPCEDCVSRKMVKKQMIKYGFRSLDMTVTEFVEDVLPSVYPTPKTGQNVLEELKQEFCNRYPQNAWGDYELGGLASHFSLREVLEILDKYADKKEGAE